MQLIIGFEVTSYAYEPMDKKLHFATPPAFVFPLVFHAWHRGALEVMLKHESSVPF